MIVEEMKILFECVRCKSRVTNITYTSKDLGECIKNVSLRCPCCHPIEARRRIVHLSAKRVVTPTVRVSYRGSCLVCGSWWEAEVKILEKDLRDALGSDNLGGYAKCLQCDSDSVDVLRVSLME